MIENFNDNFRELCLNLKIDKRIRAVFGEVELGSVTSSPANTREGILADQESEEARFFNAH